MAARSPAEHGVRPDGWELEVIRAVLHGERPRFAEIVEAHQQFVFNMVLRQVGSTDAAQDIAQEVFLRAYRGLSGFRGESTFRTWLGRIVMNACHSYFVSRGFKERAATSTFEEHMAGVEEGPEAEVSLREGLARLRGCVAKLKPHYRRVVVLCGFEGRTYQEAAQELGLPVGTVCSRMNQALQLLRKSFFKA